MDRAIRDIGCSDRKAALGESNRLSADAARHVQNGMTFRPLGFNDGRELLALTVNRLIPIRIDQMIEGRELVVEFHHGVQVALRRSLMYPHE